MVYFTVYESKKMYSMKTFPVFCELISRLLAYMNLHYIAFIQLFLVTIRHTGLQPVPSLLSQNL